MLTTYSSTDTYQASTLCCGEMQQWTKQGLPSWSPDPSNASIWAHLAVPTTPLAFPPQSRWTTRGLTDTTGSISPLGLCAWPSPAWGPQWPSPLLPPSLSLKATSSRELSFISQDMRCPTVYIYGTLCLLDSVPGQRPCFTYFLYLCLLQAQHSIWGLCVACWLHE